jgi:hypothetical protein
MTEKPDLTTQRNIVTHKAHRKQVIWQIIIPLALAIGVALVLAVLAGIAGTEEVSIWADISVIFLVIPVIIVSLLLLLLLMFGVFGVGKALKIIPQYTYHAQEVISKIEQGICKVSDGTVQPFIRVRGISAALHALISTLGSVSRR